MAKHSAIMKFLPDAIDENEAMLRGLRARNVADNRTREDFNKLFNNLNTRIKTQLVDNNNESTSLKKSVKDLRYGPIPECSSGSWWGIRMDCSRHRIHQPFDLDVDDGPFGATSICISYPNSSVDADHGDLLTFTGREFVEGILKNESLVLNYRNRIPLRLVRSYSLTNEYAPKTGLRYDGLYTIVTHWIGISKDGKKRHKFALVRISNEEQPAWKKNVTDSSIKLINPSCTLTSVNKKRPLDDANEAASKKFKSKTPEVWPLKKKAENVETNSTAASSVANCHTRLQNTNISIRTNLYNSMYGLQQQDIKEPITLYKLLESPKVKTVYERHKAGERVSSEIPNPKNNMLLGSTKEAKVERIKMNTRSCKYATASNAQDTKKAGNGDRVQNATEGTAKANEQNAENHRNNSLDSLTPDKILNLVVNDKCHPMAKLLIQNIIGVNIEEAKVLKAYETLTSKTEKKLTNKAAKKKKPQRQKENRITRTRMSLRNTRRRTRNRSLEIPKNHPKCQKETEKAKPQKKPEPEQRSSKDKNSLKSANKRLEREMTNLAINAKISPIARGPRNRRLRRSIRRNGIVKNDVLSQKRVIQHISKACSRILPPSKVVKVKILPKASKTAEKSQRPKTADAATQCSLLLKPSVDSSQQTDQGFNPATKMEFINLEEVKSEMDQDEEEEEEDEDEQEEEEREEIEDDEQDEEPRVKITCSTPSAFASVHRLGNSLRIARLRSIGFKPIEGPRNSEANVSRKDINEEYIKYISEENNIVGYMDEELHYQDIEGEDRSNLSSKSNVNTLNYPKLKTYYSIKPVESSSTKLAEGEVLLEDTEKPWHGWKKVSYNNKVFWMGW